MFGPGGIGDGINTETGEGNEECGVVPRAFVELFRLAKVMLPIPKCIPT